MRKESSKCKGLGGFWCRAELQGRNATKERYPNVDRLELPIQVEPLQSEIARDLPMADQQGLLASDLKRLNVSGEKSGDERRNMKKAWA